MVWSPEWRFFPSLTFCYSHLPPLPVTTWPRHCMKQTTALKTSRRITNKQFCICQWNEDRPDPRITCFHRSHRWRTPFNAVSIVSRKLTFFTSPIIRPVTVKYFFFLLLTAFSNGFLPLFFFNPLCIQMYSYVAPKTLHKVERFNLYAYPHAGWRLYNDWP